MNNKEHVQKWRKHHYEVHKNEILAQSRAYYYENRDKILARKRKLWAMKKAKKAKNK